jgi:hypothetical protein
MYKLLLTSLAVLGSAFSLNASAVPITYIGSASGPGGVPVSASAIFDITGNTLTITLKNTSPSNSGQDVPGSTLSGLFWDFTGNPGLTPVSATVAAGSIIGICDSATCATITDVGGEFGYQATAFAGGADRGIASSGYLSTGLPGNIGNFNNGAAGTDLDNPDSLNGINFGIISAAAGYNPNGGLANDPVIRDAVTFVLTGVNGLTNANISNVSFQYGTDASELNVPGTVDGGGGSTGNVPEPTTAAMFGLGLLGLAAVRRQARKNHRGA